MKKRLPILALAFLLCCFSRAYGQGWERTYDDFYNYFDVKSLPSGHFVFNSWYDVLVSDGLGNILHTTPTVADSLIAVGGSGPGNLIVMDDGSVTGLAFNKAAAEAPTLPFLYNLDPATGQFRWSAFLDELSTGSSYFEAKRILRSGDGGYYLMCDFRPNGSTVTRPALAKTDSLGNVLWTESYLSAFPPDNPGRSRNIAFHPQGGLAILVDADVFPDNYILRVGPDGAFISNTRLSPIFPDGFSLFDANHFLPQPDGSYLMAGRKTAGNTSVATVFRAEADGQIGWSTTLEGQPSGTNAMKQKPDGTIVVLSSRFYNGNAIILNALTPDGDILWWNEHPYPFWLNSHSFDFTLNDGFIIAGESRIYGLPGGVPESGAYLLRLGARGQLYSSQVEGYVFEDIDGDCSQLPEMPLPGWLVALEGADTLYALTDSLGRYTRRLNPGAYQARVYPPSDYWGLCPPPQLLAVPDADTLALNFPVQTAIACPNLQVDISAPFLRRCFDAEYTVYYCNTGTVPAPDAYVEVELDPYLTFNSATLPVSSQQGDTYTFQLGDIDVSACGSFRILTTVDCDSTVLGQTHCTTAHIYPDSICGPSMNWSGASVEVDGACQGDSVRFSIRNVGTAPNIAPLEYLVIEDQVILRQGTFNLAPNDSQEVILPATGATLRLEAEQEPFHPGNSRPTVTVEGCGPIPNISLGYTMQYWEDDGDDFISIDCQENIGSYDPNDKRANPKGYGDDELIPPNTDIEYHIRFQNTGTDTAFTVRILDQLADELDITTVRPGAGSHPYTFDILPGRWLEFRFENILLPDENTNEPASHGFVKFRVAQLPNLPDSALIRNRAAIYFDFNDPIITNTYQHIVMRDFLPTSLQPDPESPAATRIYPNPFEEHCTIELEKASPEEPVQMDIYDSTGRLVRRDQYTGPSFTFQRKRLPRGLYFYRISQRNRLVGKGKLIVQ